MPDNYKRILFKWGMRTSVSRMNGWILSMVFLFLWAPLAVLSQENCSGTEVKKAEKYYNAALKSLRNRNTYEALIQLNKAIEHDEEYGDALWRIGSIHYNRQNIELAERYLLRLVNVCPEYNAEVYFMLASIALGKDDYSASIPFLNTFLSDVDKIKSDRDYEIATLMLDHAKFMAHILGNEVPFNPSRVMKVSTSDDEYLAIISPDGEQVYFTRRMKEGGHKGAIEWSGKIKEVLMMSEKTSSEFTEGTPMPYPFNSQGNEGGITITGRNDEVFVAICQNTTLEENILYNNCDLYYSKLIYDQWTDLVKLSENEISLPDTWESQPTVSSDGKTLFFASDRPGGFGGSDLYVVYKDEHNHWGKPKNLGPVINTTGHEKTPFIHTDSQTLYFSSSDRTDHNDSLHLGHKGLGGYDIFISRYLDGQWSKPKNLGYPINSNADDLSFFVSTDGSTGYFSSNKIEGSGGYDLYAFELYPEVRPQKVLFVKGEIKDEYDLPVQNASIELKNIATNEVKKVEVDSLSGKYVATAIFEDDFVLTVKKPDHIYQSRFIDKDSATFRKPAVITFEMAKIEKGKSYELHDIYFATNSADLTEKSLFILNEFVQFLQENEKVKIDIHGHTDDIGSDALNMELSLYRAKSVYEYLVSQGVSSKRLSYKGFGETRPIADNTTEEGRAKNRRTEFLISGR